MTLHVCLAGVTGAVGRALLPAIMDDPGLILTGAVARTEAGRDVGEAAGLGAIGLDISATLADALGPDETPTRTDVLIDYTHPTAIDAHARLAFSRSIHVVIGTTGLDGPAYDALDEAAKAADVGAVAGNFSLTAALLQHFALMAAEHLDHFEVLDYCKLDKPDAPSGTALDLAEKLASVKRPSQAVEVEDTIGKTEARGADTGGVRNHSIRLPGFASGVEAIFAADGERLHLRHECIEHGTPFVKGTLLACHRVPQIRGLVRGLDQLLFG